MPMKILHIVHAFTGGGIEQYLLNLADNIDKEQYNIEVLGTCKDDIFDRVYELEKRNIPFYRLKKTNLLHRIREWQTLLCTKKYDVVHIQGMPNTGVIWLTSGKMVRPTTKFIVHSHMGTRKGLGKGLLHSFLYKICYHLTNFLYRQLADVRAGCSYDAMQSHFGKSIGTKGILLNNGIDMKRFRDARNPQLNSRNIIIVARLAQEKNPLFAVDVMSHLAKQNSEWNLTWVGAGYLESAVKLKIRELHLEQNINLLGHRKDVPELLRHHSLFLLPSIYEAFGISLIEAQATGCLCIAANCVPESANCGALLRLPLEQGAKSWADFIVKLHDEHQVYPIDEEKLRMYDIQTTATQVIELYKSLISTTRQVAPS